MSKLDALIEAALLREDEALLHIADAADEHTFSPAFEKVIESKIRSRPPKKTAIFRRVVALAVAAVLLIGSAFAFWDEIVGLFVKAFPQYAELRVTPKVVPNEAFLNFPSDWTEVWIPEYMTDGHTYLSAVEKQKTKEICFASNSEPYTTLTFTQYFGTSAIYGDNEGTTIHNIIVSGYTANAFEKEVDGQPFRRITWSDTNYQFSLYGFVSFDELIKIGESIVLCEIGET